MSIADRKIGVDGRPLRDRSRAAPVESFATRHHELRDGLWYCTYPNCGRNHMPFPDPRSAKSHPFAAHGIKSTFVITQKRRDRRLRSEPIVSEASATRVREWVGSWPNLPEWTRKRLIRLNLETLQIPSDAPPPAMQLPGMDDLPPSNARRRKNPHSPDSELYAAWRPLTPGEEEDFRRAMLRRLKTFARERGIHEIDLCDTLGVLVDRRFFARGLGMSTVDMDRPASETLNRIANLLGRRRAAW